MARLIAFLVILLPGIVAVTGIKLIRDSFFQIFHWPFSGFWTQCFGGTFMFLAGSAFIGGFIYHRDKKRNRVKTRRFNSSR